MNNTNNEYQKNIYGYDIKDDIDEEVIHELMDIDTSFHTNTQSLVQKYVEPLLKKVVQEPIPRDDIEFNEEPPILTDSEYYLTQLYRFIKSQNAPLIVQRFVETYA